MFAAVGKDKSGLLDVVEVKALAKQLGWVMGDEDEQQAMEKIDDDNSGEVDFQDFFGWYLENI